MHFERFFKQQMLFSKRNTMFTTIKLLGIWSLILSNFICSTISAERAAQLLYKNAIRNSTILKKCLQANKLEALEVLFSNLLQPTIREQTENESQQCYKFLHEYKSQDWNILKLMYLSFKIIIYTENNFLFEDNLDLELTDTTTTSMYEKIIKITEHKQISSEAEFSTTEASKIVTLKQVVEETNQVFNQIYTNPRNQETFTLFTKISGILYLYSKHIYSEIIHIAKLVSMTSAFIKFENIIKKSLINQGIIWSADEFIKIFDHIIDVFFALNLVQKHTKICEGEIIVGEQMVQLREKLRNSIRNNLENFLRKKFSNSKFNPDYFCFNIQSFTIHIDYLFELDYEIFTFIDLLKSLVGKYKSKEEQCKRCGYIALKFAEDVSYPKNFQELEEKVKPLFKELSENLDLFSNNKRMQELKAFITEFNKLLPEAIAKEKKDDELYYLKKK